VSVSATRLVESVIPEGSRRQTLGFIARSIAYADREAGDPDQVIAYAIEGGRRFRVLAGRLSVMSTWKGGLYVEMDRQTLGAQMASELGRGRQTEENQFANVPPPFGIRFEFDELDRVEALVRPAHEAFIAHSLELGHSQHMKRHDPALLALLRRD
jgi:hypothetical protein